MPAARRRRERSRKRADLGQHFLRRGALAASLVAQSSIGPRDAVVEIGAGRGALTRELLRHAGHVTAVELDPALARALGPSPHLTVVQADFLRWPLPSSDWKVFGNVPFARTAEIVRRVTEAPRPPLDAWLVVEAGAARRFAGMPWAKETRRSLLLKPWWHVEILGTLRPRDFEPPPRAEAALLWLSRRLRPLLPPDRARAWGAFVAATRGCDRPTVRTALRGILTRQQLARQAALLRFDRDGSPAVLTFDQWLGLFRCVVRGRAVGRSR